MMNKLSTIILLFTIFLFSFTCKDAVKQKKYLDGDKNKKSNIINFPKGTTGIIGTIQSIDKGKLSKDINSPCSKVPCWASVKIDSVLGVGQGGPLFSVGDTITTKFVFTLNETTTELIPNLDTRLPGLKIGNKFSTNIRTLVSQNFNNKESLKLYSISLYTKE